VDFKEMAWEVADWMHLAQDKYQMRALVSTVVNLWVWVIS
jgi:hypothetical protein